MTILSTTKETKEEKLNRKRNLFGLGVTSLIAACGADKAANDVNIEPFVPPGEEEPAVILPSGAERLSKATNSGFTTALGGDGNQFTVTITKGTDTPETLTFVDGMKTASTLSPDNSLANKAGIYKLTAIKDQFDLVIASPSIDTESGPEKEKGRIFIFWDIAKIEDESIGRSVDPATNTNKYLEVKGATAGDKIGIHAPEFLQIASDTKYDMVIRAHWVDSKKGAIYVLWDVAEYKTETLNKVITLDNDLSDDATAGSLAIYGGIANDVVGEDAPNFLQIGGKENNYDMVIGSQSITKVGLPDAEGNLHGTIYILWDIADYAGKTVNIDLGDFSQATSGLLAIYGPHNNSNLGLYESIMHGEDAAGNKTLTNIDGDDAGTNDIAFQDTNYTYILFGDKIAEVDSTTQKVTSKAIDLDKVKAAFDVDPPDAGFFKYNFGDDPTIISDDTNATIVSIQEADTATGYRFASGTGHQSERDKDKRTETGHKTFAEVEKEYKGLFPEPSTSTGGLSDADADLGVWDIA